MGSEHTCSQVYTSAQVQLLAQTTQLSVPSCHYPAVSPCTAMGLAWTREGCRELLLQQLHGQGDNCGRRQAAEAVQRQQPGPRGQARQVGLEAAGGARGVQGGGMVVEEGVGARGVSGGCGMTRHRGVSQRLEGVVHVNCM